MMTPYATLQIVYFLASGCIVGAAWRYSGVVAGKERRWTRTFLVGIAIVFVAFVLVLTAMTETRGHTASAFRSVAFALYGGAFWLPCCVILAALRRPRAPILAALSVTAIAVGVWATAFEPNRLTERHETLEVSAWPKDTKPFRIVHISDLQTTGACARNDRALAMVNALAPDLIVVTGDYMAGPFSNVAPAVDAARSFLKGLRARLGVICVEGHSETKNEWSLIFTKDVGVEFIHDEMRTFDLGDGRHVRLFGGAVHEVEPVDPDRVSMSKDGETYRTEDFSKLATSAPAGTITIVATHVPDSTYVLEGKGVDLHLAGHTHGGQVCIPGYGAPVMLSDLPPSMARGFFRVGDHALNICAGIGMEGNHAPPLRAFCPPEICVIEIKGAAAAK